MERQLLFITQAGFVVLVLATYLFFLRLIRKGIMLTEWDEVRKKKIFSRATLAVCTWLIFLSVLSIRGFFNNFETFPPRFVIVLIIPLLSILVVTFSRTTRDVLIALPIKSLTQFQVFRVFVEILLWMMFLRNIIPVQMTFEGRNYDIVVGLTAPFVSHFLSNNRKMLITWNVISLMILMNIVGTAILSFPSPFRVFMNEPSSSAVSTFPFVFLPGFLVPIAYGLHFLSLRKLTIKV